MNKEEWGSSLGKERGSSSITFKRMKKGIEKIILEGHVYEPKIITPEEHKDNLKKVEKNEQELAFPFFYLDGKIVSREVYLNWMEKFFEDFKKTHHLPKKEDKWKKTKD